MRKPFSASLTACLLAASMVGCGEKSQENIVSDQLATLLDQMSRLQYADAPIKGNDMQYTLGKEVDGVKVPGSTRFEAAYLDQALALLPLAQTIEKDGTKLQKQSANAIIGSIRTDEASFLIDEAERAFQQGAKEVVALRSKLSLLNEIQAINQSVAGDRSEVIETYRAGLRAGGTQIIGINDLQKQAEAAAQTAQNASAQLASYSQQISELRDKVAEYEALELRLTSKARASQSSDRFDTLDQATAAAKEAELAQAQVQKLEIDAWIAERVARLAEFKRQQYAGQAQSSPADLLSKLDGMFTEAASQTNIPSSSDTYAGLAQVLSQAKATPGDSEIKAAAFLLAMSEYANTPSVDADQRRLLVSAIDQQINSYLGLTGALEMKIAQIKLDRQRVADKLAEIERDRKAVIDELTAAFNKHDAMIQAAGFDRMTAAMDSLKLAEQAVKSAGADNDLKLMSVYMLQARTLHQQSLSARSYQTTLSSFVAAGPEILGSELHATLVSRVQEMQALLGQVASATSSMRTEADATASVISATLDPESARGQIATRQMEVYQSLLASLAQGGTPVTPDTQAP